MTSYIILAESLAQLAFFSRFKKWIDTHAADAVVVTDKVSVYSAAVFRYRLHAVLVTRRGARDDDNRLTGTVELITRSMDRVQAAVLFSSTLDAVLSIAFGRKDILLMVWSGTTVSSLAFTTAGERLSVPVLYFDRGNIPGTIFVDTRGTNMDSYIYRHPELLDRDTFELPIDAGDGEADGHRILSVMDDRVNLLIGADIIMSKVAGLPFRGEKNIIRKLQQRTGPYHLRYCTKYQSGNRKYCFIALSHSNEMKREGTDPAAAVAKITGVFERAVNEGADIVIKFHPGETDRNFVDIVARAADTNHMFIVDSDSENLISRADTVFLFNTSLAIEAILQRKKYRFLCRSFYEIFTYDRLKRFIGQYLITAFIDDNAALTDGTMRRILERVRYR